MGRKKQRPDDCGPMWPNSVGQITAILAATFRIRALHKVKRTGERATKRMCDGLFLVLS